MNFSKFLMWIVWEPWAWPILRFLRERNASRKLKVTNTVVVIKNDLAFH